MQDVAPSRGRGSKPLSLLREWLAIPRSPPHGGVDRNTCNGEAQSYTDGRPLTGAWIETAKPWDRHPSEHVAPSRGRGSKHVERVDLCVRLDVAPSRGRGSKLGSREVTGRAHASPPHGGVDRNGENATAAREHIVAPSRGRGSKQSRDQCANQAERVAPSRGRGSKP